MYAVELTENAAMTLRKLDTEERERIIKKIHSIREDPFAHLKKLTGNHFWRLRIGDYRAIIDVVIKGKTIYVLKIDKRERVY